MLRQLYLTYLLQQERVSFFAPGASPGARRRRRAARVLLQTQAHGRRDIDRRHAAPTRAIPVDEAPERRRLRVVRAGKSGGPRRDALGRDHEPVPVELH